jgi:hypothetical protein
MRIGPALCAFAMVCLFLVGPVGPCGPGSPLGLPLMFGGAGSLIIGWLISFFAFLRAVWRGPRSRLGTAALAALGTACGLAFAASYMNAAGPKAWSAAATTAVLSWPPLAAASVVVGTWLQGRKANAAVPRQSSDPGRPTMR